MSLFGFDPISSLKNAYNSVSNFVSNDIIKPVTSTYNSLVNAPVDQPGILGTIGRLADSTKTAATSTQNLTGNISTSLLGGFKGGTLNPTPVPGPTVGVPGTTYQSGQGVITPSGSFNVPSGQTQTYFPPPVATSTGNYYSVKQPDGSTALYPKYNQFGYQNPTPGTEQNYEQINDHGVTSYIPVQGPVGTSGGGGSSSGQFGGGSSIFNINGGAAMLPTSLGSLTSRSAGGFSPISTPSESEDINNRKNILNKANFSPSFGNVFRSLTGIPTANAGTTSPLGATSSSTITGGQPSPTPQPGQAPTQGGSFFGNLFQGLGQMFSPSNLFGGGNSYAGQIYGPNPSSPNGFGVGLSNFQTQLVNSLGPNPPTVKSSQTFTPVSGKEYSAATLKSGTNPTLHPTDTLGNATQNYQTKVTQILQTQNAADAANKQAAVQKAQQAALQQLTAGGDVYFKQNDPNNPGQIDIFKVGADGQPQHVLMPEFQQKFGGDPSKIPDAAQLGQDFDTAFKQIHDTLISPTTDRPYVKEDKIPEPDDVNAKALKDIQDQLDKSPLPDIDIQALQDKFIHDTGLADYKNQRRTLQDTINALLNQNESDVADIKANPDLSKNLQNKRISFFTDLQNKTLHSYQRQLDLLNNEITDASNTVAQNMKNAVDQYNTQLNKRKELEAEQQKIQSVIDKASDNDRALVNTVLTQFGSGTLTPEQQQSIKDQLNNKGLINLITAGLTNKQKSLELQLQSVKNSTPAGNTFIYNGTQQTGDKVIKYPTSPTDVSKILTPLQQTGLQKAGISQPLYSAIASDILSGRSLDDIRNTLRQNGQYTTTDGRPVLDVFDQIVDIAGLLAKETYNPDKTTGIANPFP